MKYTLFVQLFKEGLEYASEEMFIAERGWQEWMDQFEDVEEVTFILKKIFYYTSRDLRKIREDLKLSRINFSRTYDIPLRTVEAWEYGTTKMSNYDRMFISYTFFMNELVK